MTIDLQPFCAVDDIRDYLKKPFAVDGHTVATNGQLLIRVPGVAAGVDDAYDNLRDSVRKMFARSYTDFVPLPQIPDRVACGHCNGVGSLKEDDCDECDGVGEFTHGSHSYTCDECNGTGRIKGPANCHQCGGDGEVFTRVEIGVEKFQARLLRKIAGLPNVRISAPDVWEPAAFTFDGGDGRLMPCR